MLKLETAPGHLLRRCHQRSREIYDELIGPGGPSRPQLAVLITMARHPGLNLAQLSDASGFDRNTLAEMLTRISRKGYIERLRSPQDARAYEVWLTPKGARLVQDLMPRSHEVQRRILQPLPAALRPIFVRCLRLLIGLEGSAARAPIMREDAESRSRGNGPRMTSKLARTSRSSAIAAGVRSGARP